MNAVSDKLASIAGPENLMVNEPMRLHTTFRVGGPADYFVRPQTIDQLAALLAFCRENEQPCYVIGNGSNLLVSDEGYRGVIIQLFQNHDHIRVEGTRIIAQSGAMLSRIASLALQEGLTGFEFASGIPGTFGGACVMNAGAYGGELKDVLVSVSVMDQNGTVSTISPEAMELGYRTSRFPKNQEIVLEGTLSLHQGDPAEIRANMMELTAKRKEKQPLEFASAGSTFKRPAGYFAGKLIEDAGLRGFSVGGAAVSEKHCGFVVNKGTASAADVWKVITHVQEEVYRQSGVQLQTEVKLLGSFS